uniref:Uncharacterized protein n=1 Tax=Rhizophora mucronata TaxID=61149 RepID=A0A2P2NU44_RHIMU
MKANKSKPGSKLLLSRQ